MENALTTYADMDQMAGNIVRSGMFAMKTKEQALCLMAVCQAEGLHPMQAVRRYHIMNGGRPAMRADAMQAEFQRQGGIVKWIHRDDKICKAEFSHASGGSVVIEWTIDMAQKAGLTRNQTWMQYPRQMLTARVVSEGVRTVLPGVVAGIYTPEEIDDFGAKPPEPPPTPAAPAPSRAATRGTTGKATPKVEEGQFSPAPVATPDPSSEGIAPVATAADPAPKLADEPPPSGASAAQQSFDPAGHDSHEPTSAISLPEGIPEIAPTTFKDLVALTKALKPHMPPEEHEALRADLNRCANDSARVVIMQKAIDGLKGGF